MNTTTGKEQRYERVPSKSNEKMIAMLTLEGRRKDDTDATKDAECTLQRLGWTEAMIRVWRNRRIPSLMRSKA